MTIKSSFSNGTFTFVGNCHGSTIGDRTLCSPIKFLSILVIIKIDFVIHLYDYRPDWTPLTQSSYHNNYGNRTVINY